jgi:hypothetical protein
VTEPSSATVSVASPRIARPVEHALAGVDPGADPVVECLARVREVELLARVAREAARLHLPRSYLRCWMIEAAWASTGWLKRTPAMVDDDRRSPATPVKNGLALSIL